MINSMVAATISQNGLDKNSPMEGRRKACMLFAKMMFKAKRLTFWQFCGWQ